MDLIDREQLKSTVRKMVEIPNETRAQVIGAISRAKAVDGWIPVTERLPEKDVKVLTFGVYGFSVNYRDRFSGKWRGVNGRPQWITHWMPLPQAPKGE